MTENNWHYFSPDEVKNLDLEFVALLDQARHIAGVPFIISSGYRTPEHNGSVGGVDGSSHCSGLAVDLVVNDSRQAGLILKGLRAVGLNRIGHYYIKGFDGVLSWAHIHVDNDKSKDQDVAWAKLEHWV